MLTYRRVTIPHPIIPFGTAMAPLTVIGARPGIIRMQWWCYTLRCTSLGFGQQLGVGVSCGNDSLLAIGNEHHHEMVDLPMVMFLRLPLKVPKYHY